MANSKSKNPLLKRANQQHGYTVDQIVEIARCEDDPEYFVNTYCQLQHPVQGLIPFTLRPYQKKMIAAYKDNRLCITLAARQVGKCLYPNSRVDTTKRSSINKLKKLILWIINRDQYDTIFKSM